MTQSPISQTWYKKYPPKKREKKKKKKARKKKEDSEILTADNAFQVSLKRICDEY